MGRTLEVLAGRLKKAAGAEATLSMPLRVPKPAPAPEPAPESTDGPVLVPFSSDDLPGDQENVPHVEVGGPRKAQPVGPQLMPPRPAPVTPGPEVAFQLLPESAYRAAPVPGLDLIAYHRPEHPSSRQYRRLADGIAAQHQGGRPPVLLFTPATARTAGTATVVNLAATRAADGLGRVLVIETQRGPGSPAERLGIPAIPGLRELLARTVPLGLGLHRTAMEGVYLIPAGLVDVGTEEAARLPGLLDQLRGRFDWILVDTPVWGTFPLADWARISDGVYLVVHPDEWDSPQADMAHDGIARIGGRLRGCITTQELPAPRASADDNGRRNEVVNHVGPAVGIPHRRLRVPHVVRRPGDD